MSVSLFLAQIIGPYYLIVGIGMLLNMEYAKRMYGEFLKNEGLLYLGGLIAFIGGLTIVRLSSVWPMHWLVSIFGWLGLLKGIIIFVFPTWAMKTFKHWKLEKRMKEIAILVLALGIIFSYVGYVA